MDLDYELIEVSETGTKGIYYISIKKLHPRLIIGAIWGVASLNSGYLQLKKIRAVRNISVMEES